MLTTFFRFHLTMDLLFSYTLPTIWACSGLTPVRARPWRANQKAKSALIHFSLLLFYTYLFIYIRTFLSDNNYTRCQRYSKKNNPHCQLPFIPCFRRWNRCADWIYRRSCFYCCFLLLFLLLSLSDFLIQKFRPVSFPFLHSRCFAHFPFPAFQFCLHPVFLMHLSQVDSARQVHPAFPVHLFQVHPVHSAFPVHLFQVHPVHSVFPVHLFQVRLVHPAFQVRLVHPAFPVHLFQVHSVHPAFPVRLFQVHSVHPVFQVRLSQVRSVHLAFLPESDNLYFHL